MLDLKYVLANLGELEKIVQKRNSGKDVIAEINKIPPLAGRRSALILKTEELKATRNKVSDEIAKIKKGSGEAGNLIDEMKKVSSEIKTLDVDLNQIEKEIEQILLCIPNVLHESVPIGIDSNSNVEIRKWGKLPEFNFKIKDHVELGESLGILDLETAGNITGSRFALYRRELASLERALINFMLDEHTRKGYEETLPPFLVNSSSMKGTGQLPKFAEDSFKVEGTDYWLIPTGEVPLTNIFGNTILEKSNLPISLVAYTPCFRKEAGSYGKDIRGIIRQHQFNKVELVKFSDPEESVKDLETLLNDAEMILQKLDLPYRVVQLCSGDINANAILGYDIEVWIPTQRKYREISSVSLFGDYQARRANIKFRPDKKAKPLFAHTINGSALAVGRTVVAIMENFQNEDGSIRIPEVLVPYMRGKTIIR